MSGCSPKRTGRNLGLSNIAIAVYLILGYVGGRRLCFRLALTTQKRDTGDVPLREPER